MKTKILFSSLLLCTMLLAFGLPVQAQKQGAIPRIGVVRAGTLPDPLLEAFLQGLRDTGYVDGKTFTLRHVLRRENQPALLTS